jgi:hypothetical protein
MSAISEPSDVTSLRGAEPQPIGRTVWLVAGTLLLLVLALIVTVSFISAANDNGRIERLQSHGVLVEVTVTGCVGNIGGSGSNAAGYTCRGEYRVNGVRYREVIGSKSSLSTAGSTVRAVADPSRPSTIELASAVTRLSASLTVYVVPSLLALLLVALGFTLLWRQKVTSRRRQL